MEAIKHLPPFAKLGDILVADGAITEEQLKKTLAEQQYTSERLGALLIRLGFAVEENVYRGLSKQMAIDFLNNDQLLDLLQVKNVHCGDLERQVTAARVSRGRVPGRRASAHMVGIIPHRATPYKHRDLCADPRPMANCCRITPLASVIATARRLAKGRAVGPAGAWCPLLRRRAEGPGRDSSPSLEDDRTSRCATTREWRPSAMPVGLPP